MTSLDPMPCSIQVSACFGLPDGTFSSIIGRNPVIAEAPSQCSTVLLIGAKLSLSVPNRVGVNL